MLINDARTAIDLYRQADTPHRQRRYWVTLSKKGLALREGIFATEDWMHRAWTWCDENAGHLEFVEREDRLIEAIRDYEAMYQALWDVEAELWPTGGEE